MIFHFCGLSIFLLTISMGSSRHSQENICALPQVQPLAFSITWCPIDPCPMLMLYNLQRPLQAWSLICVRAYIRIIENSYSMYYKVQHLKCKLLCTLAICFPSPATWIHGNPGNVTSLPFGTCSVILQLLRNKYLSFAVTMERF